MPDKDTSAPRFTIEELGELHRLAVKLQLDRHTLLSGLNPSLVARIHVAPSTLAQILVDLHTLNRVGVFANGSDPLKHWLMNARLLAEPQQEEAIFVIYASLLEQRSSGPPSLQRIPLEAGPQRARPRSPDARSRVRVFDDVLLALERHTLVFAAHPIAREGGFTIAGSIGPIAAGLMRCEGMHARHFPGPVLVDERGQPSRGVVEVAIGIRPTGEFVVGFTFIGDVDDHWLSRFDAFLAEVRELGGSVRIYFLDQNWFEHEGVDQVSIRAELSRFVGPSLRRHAARCIDLWPQAEELRFQRSPIIAVSGSDTLDTAQLLPPGGTNHRLMLVGATGSGKSTLLRRYAARMAKAYLENGENASAPMLVGLQDDTPDWNLLFWRLFPELQIDHLRLAIGCDMVVPLLDGLERLCWTGSCPCTLTTFVTESFGPFSRMVTSCNSSFYETTHARNALPAAHGGLYSVAWIPSRGPVGGVF